jgi:hypothetical protein
MDERSRIMLLRHCNLLATSCMRTVVTYLALVLSEDDMHRGS